MKNTTEQIKNIIENLNKKSETEERIPELEDTT